ncbi:hypothetical protein LK994_08275 [Ferruginibacter lapsinanis]|uniref:hypothetical protein n=1 Tax=Ferruginibacter lapsinanis TaxID=563172 RepID=UPI001E4AB17A|nr:hypothetical protein [Ferruginibacter lapsinanis]UEG48631.1 hypothetical protein LK994_08275 [Ferruginibacter lapsinanis]
MSKIILQPSGNRDAREHYLDTIETPVPLTRIQPHITAEEFQNLSQIYPTGLCYVWGVTPGGNNITKWDRIQRGDVTLFSKEGAIYASGVTTFKLHSRNLASTLWGYNNNGETWEYVYFLEEIRNLNIPYIEFNTTVGYANNYVIQGFGVLTEEQSNLVFNRFDLASEVFIPVVNAPTFENLINLLDNLEDTEREITTTRRLEQGYLKTYLFGNNTNGTCACCKKVYPVSYLVTAHIKKRSYCTPQEKRDLNVVMPMCKFGCDELFEKGYIIVENGQFVSLNKTPTSLELENYINQLTDTGCTYYNQNTVDYFNWHKEHHK